jgi:hypothetical protein
MSDSATLLLHRAADVRAVHAPVENAPPPMEQIETWTPATPVHLDLYEIEPPTLSDDERDAELRLYFALPLVLLALFVVIFVTYLIFAAAELL